MLLIPKVDTQEEQKYIYIYIFYLHKTSLVNTICVNNMQQNNNSMQKMQMWILWTKMMHIRILNTFNTIALLSLSSKNFVPSSMLISTTHKKNKINKYFKAKSQKFLTSINQLHFHFFSTNQQSFNWMIKKHWNKQWFLTLRD